MADFSGYGSDFLGGAGFDQAPTDSSNTPPFPDNSGGAPPMDGSTPTGNGSGQWMSVIGNSLAQGLQYAIKRDQANYAATPTPVQTAQIQIRQQQSKNSTLLIFGALILGGIFLMKEA
jgi:hypothetical protein